MNNTNSNNPLDDTYTLEWNQKQKKFHIGLASDMFSRNANDYMNDVDQNWYMLGVFPSYKAASKYRVSLSKEKKKMA